jgi:hypothetical protein
MWLFIFYVSSSFWKQIIEKQSISLQTFDDFDQLANNFIQQTLCSSSKISKKDSSLFDNSSDSQSKDKINQIYQKCNDNVIQLNTSSQSQRIEKNVTECENLQRSTINAYQIIFHEKTLNHVQFVLFSKN